MTPTERAAARLGRAEFAPLVEQLINRYGTGSAPVRVRLPELSAAARQALSDLLGLDRLLPPGRHLPVARLCAALGLGSDAELRAVLERLRGPLPDRRAEREAAQAEREALWAWLDDAADRLDLGTGPGRLGEWSITQRQSGARGGVAATRDRLSRSLTVLRALPADGIALATFAQDLLNGPHDLDHGTALTRTVLEAVAGALDLPRPGTAEEARALWESVGVVPDALSSTVLVLGLPGPSDSPLGRTLSAMAAASEPVLLTLAQLRRWPVPPLPAGRRIYVVENPSVISTAVSTGWSGPPMVCSSGRPTIATVTLIRQLTAAGAAAHQHADFDPAGLSITAWLARQAGTLPWMMSAPDYLAHVGESVPFGDLTVPETPWDPRLRSELERHRRPVYEEQVRHALLDAMT